MDPWLVHWCWNPVLASCLVSHFYSLICSRNPYLRSEFICESLSRTFKAFAQQPTNLAFKWSNLREYAAWQFIMSVIHKVITVQQQYLLKDWITKWADGEGWRTSGKIKLRIGENDKLHAYVCKTSFCHTHMYTYKNSFDKLKLKWLKGKLHMVIISVFLQIVIIPLPFLVHCQIVLPGSATVCWNHVISFGQYVVSRSDIPHFRTREPELWIAWLRYSLGFFFSLSVMRCSRWWLLLSAWIAERSLNNYNEKSTLPPPPLPPATHGVNVAWAGNTHLLFWATDT